MNTKIRNALKFLAIRGLVFIGTVAFLAVNGGEKFAVAAEKNGSANSVDESKNVALFRDADRLAAQKDYAGAVSLLRKNLRSTRDRQNADVLYRLGYFSRLAGDENSAQKFWARGYEEYPTVEAGRMCALAIADTLFAQIDITAASPDDLEKVRDFYSGAIGMDGAKFIDEPTATRICDRLNQLSEKLIFSPNVKTRGAEFYVVQSGDNLTRIAKKFGLDTWYSLTEINRVNPKNLRVGQRLKIMPGRVFIVVNKRNFTLSWSLNGVFVRCYPCAIGEAATETPVGRYTASAMEVNPDWRDPHSGQTFKYGDPGHLIGTRWIAISGENTSGLGIHGTVDPDSIGTKASNGCIRLLAKDVEELYGFVSVQRGNETEILVVE